jgi:hypothetical protein
VENFLREWVRAIGEALRKESYGFYSYKSNNDCREKSIRI